MATGIHQLDDGAWVSVDDRRVTSVSDLWLLDGEFCSCRLTDFLAEAFVEVGVDGTAVEARIAGQCIGCGTAGVTEWVRLGCIDPETGTFRSVVPSSVHRPHPAGRR